MTTSWQGYDVVGRKDQWQINPRLQNPEVKLNSFQNWQIDQIALIWNGIKMGKKKKEEEGIMVVYCP